MKGTTCFGPAASVLLMVLAACYGPRGDARRIASATMAEADAERPPYVFAFYDADNLLVSNPLRNVEDLLVRDPRGFSDVYVVSHGWNYTMDEAIAKYQQYLHAAERVHREHPALLAPEHRPLYVLIGWTSGTRPAGQTARSLLPFGLDDAVGLATTFVDRFAFHLPTAWKQSLNASTNALGWQQPVETEAEPWPDRRPKNRSFLGQTGFDLPVSELLFRLVEMNHEGRLRPGGRARIHAIGHSYGAKLLALASTEAMRRCRCFEDDAAPIESLVLFNAAFHPSELCFRTSWGVIGSEWAPTAELLKGIPRKAFVFSDSDLANGATFELSQMILNNQHAQGVQQVSRNLVDSLQRSAAGNVAIPPVVLLTGAIQLVWSVGAGAGQWLVRRATNTPQDFWYHLNHASFSRDWWPGVRHVANAVHYFLPLDQLWNGPADQKGLFRPSTSALGRTGLQRHVVGRPFEWSIKSFSNTGPLATFAGAGELPCEVYVEMAARLGGSECASYSDPEQFYSFDASDVLYGGVPFVGSHGALGDEGTVELQTSHGAVTTRRIDSTVRFVLNFTAASPLPEVPLPP